MSEGCILVVDDHTDESERLGALLREHGYAVELARSGDHALATLSTISPDLILMALDMSGVDGLRLCDSLREHSADIALVCVNDGGDDERRIASFEHGAIDVIDRPLEEAEVIVRIRRHVKAARVRSALVASEARFRSVMESAIDAIISADADGVIRTWNRAAERLFGHSPAEAIGRGLELIIPARYHEAHRSGMARVATGGESRVIGKTLELAAITKDGREIPIELSLSTWIADGEAAFAGIIRDISERKAAEDQLTRYAEELARKHVELRAQHDELKRSQQALMTSYRQAARMFSVMTDALPGSIIDDKYRLEEKLAEGGFGVVFAATQLTLERSVAIKFFRPPAGERADLVFQRFRREGLTASRIDHPNAVVVLDSGVSGDNLPYLVMERLEGSTLGHRLREDEPLSMRRILRIAAAVCGVLDVAHAAGIVHRDIKPSNIFLHRPRRPERDETTETIKVLDFGIARLVENDQRLGRVTQTGQLVGTPSYMAPERFRDEEETGAADVYSVGVMLHEMLSGRPLFQETSNLWAMLWRQANTEPALLKEIDPKIPDAVSDLVACALAKEPADRPTAAELQTELLRILDELPDEPDDARKRQTDGRTWLRDAPTARLSRDTGPRPRPTSDDDD